MTEQCAAWGIGSFASSLTRVRVQRGPAESGGAVRARALSHGARCAAVHTVGAPAVGEDRGGARHPSWALFAVQRYRPRGTGTLGRISPQKIHPKVFIA